jgi:prostaglandin-E synthase
LLLWTDLPEIKNPKVDLTETTFTFSGQSNGKDYAVTITFFKEVEKDTAKWQFHGKQASFVIRKKESGPYWARLTKDSGKLNWLKADWDKWVDESDEDEDALGGGGGDDFGAYDSMPDFSQFSGGAGSDDESDDDGSSNLALSYGSKILPTFTRSYF